MYCQLKYMKHNVITYYKELTINFLLKGFPITLILVIPTVYFYGTNGLWKLNILLIIIALILLSIKADKYCKEK